jgi:23S rRNA (cytosine1962-C5)-methyltransferase
MSDYIILKTEPGAEYELVDSGNGEKMERYGAYLVARPDPQALWPKRLPDAEWKKANAYFTRVSQDANWSTRGTMPERWPIEVGGLKMWIKLSAFKHTGLFPEHVPSWGWLRQQVESRKSVKSIKFDGAESPVQVLNLFGYTGGASLACAQAGAEVCHVDGSKVAIGWARDNAELSGLKEKKIRWILDDAFKFVEREVKRGRKYDGILLDPPAFGHGPKGELWKIEDCFMPLIESCKKILTDKPLFFLINGYAAGYSALAYRNNLLALVKQYGGSVEVGELTIGEKGSERLLPAGIFARWSAN